MINGTTRIDQINQNSLVVSMEALAARLEPENSVLDTLTRKIGGGIENVGRMKTEWRERRLALMSDTVGAAGAAQSATSVPVANASSYHRDQIIMCPETEDMFLVDEDVGGTAVAGQVKVRGKAGNGGITTALTSGMVLLIGPEAHAEGEEIPPSFANVETEEFTYLMQGDETIKVTDILNAEEGYGIKEIQAQRMDKVKEQLKRFGLLMYNSQKSREIISAGGPRRHTMSGLIEFLANSKTDATAVVGGLTRTTLGAIVRPTTVYGTSASQKICLPGQNAWAAISAMPDQYMQIQSGSMQKWGVTVKTLITPFGDLNLTYDPLLSQENGMAGEMFILDTKHIKQLQLRGLPRVVKTNVQAERDVHNIEDLYTGTRGLMLKLPELHRRIYGI